MDDRVDCWERPRKVGLLVGALELWEQRADQLDRFLSRN